MIRILTFFLGLTTGIHPVEFQVAGAVTQVEIHLDGTPITVLEGPPWSLDLDFGEVLSPHRLTAVARDLQGREIDRAHRLINLGDAAFDPLQNSTGFGFSQGQDLTAVAVELTDGHQAPSLHEMEGWFLVHGKPVRVLQIDAGPSEVVVVRDPAAQRWVEILASLFLQQAYGGSLPVGISGADLGLDRDSFLRSVKDNVRDTASSITRLGAAWSSWKNFLRTDDETELRFLSPLAAPASTVEGRKQIFNISTPFDAITQGFLYHAARIRPLEFDLRISDAVALAGLEAHASHKRRAVLLLLTDVPMGRSRYRPQDALEYLKTLGIPLFAWSFEETMSEWNATQIYSTQGGPVNIEPQQGKAMLSRVHEAFVHLRRNLNHQRIIWLAGAHLPQDIELAPQTRGLRLAGHFPLTGQEEVGQ